MSDDHVVQAALVDAGEPFETIAGAVSLDFANTVGGLRGGEIQEHLHTYVDLVRWARQAEILTEGEARRLLQLAQARPAEAKAVLARAREVREAIYGISVAIAAQADPPAEAIALLNDELSRALAHLGLAWGSSGFTWQWLGAVDSLDAVLWPIARSAAELLVSPTAQLVRQCANPACSWLFLDTSRNHSRRWCDMRGCGNRAKVRRHRARVREETDVTER